MKAQIRNGTILLPTTIIRSTHLPENGECEVTTEKDEIKISKYKADKKKIPVPYDIINDIRNSNITCSVEKMAKDELVEDV